MFYLTIFIILAIVGLLNLQFTDKLFRQLSLPTVTLLLIGIAGLRYETGGDWDVYTRLFNGFPTLEQILLQPSLIHNRHAEEAFLLLGSIIRQFGGSVQVLFFVVSALNLTLIAATLPRYTKYPIIALLAYYSILYFNLEMIYIRQATAVALCFYALHYVEQKRIVPYMLMVLLACLFHRVAVVMIPVYFIIDKRLPSWIYLTVVGVGAAIMFAGIPWIKEIFMTVASWLGEKYTRKAEMYTTSDKFAVTRILSIGYYLNLLLFAGLLFFKRQIDKHPYGTIHLNMFCISLCLYYYCFELVEVSNRMRLFFLISIIVLLPLILEALSCFANRLPVYLVVVAYCFSFSAAIFLEKPQAIAYNPYQNYIDFKYNPRPSDGKKRLEKSHEYFRNERKH